MNSAEVQVDTSVELTPLGIPSSLRPFFQEYDLEALDPDRDAFTVIERTLAYGNRAELRWLFTRYGQKRIVEWVKQAGWWRLPRRRFVFWLAFLDIREYRSNLWRQRIWPY